MFQCTACGLLSVRDTSCPGCGGMSFLDLEAEDSTSLEGFGEVPGLDEAATALHEIAPPPEEQPAVEEKPEGDLPFGFGGMARAHAPSLPFGFGASSLGLSSLKDEPSPREASDAEATAEAPISSDVSDEGARLAAVVEEIEPAVVNLPAPEVPSPPQGALPDGASPPMPPEAEVAAPVPIEGVAVAPHASTPEPAVLSVPDLWSRAVQDVRSAYGLDHRPSPSAASEPVVEPKVSTWPPFAVVGPEPALLDGLLREPTVEAFRALANENWSLAKERFELVLATGVDGISLRTAAGIACMELGEDNTAGLQHLKQAAKLSGGNLTTLHNLVLGMAMDGRVEGVERLLATVAELPDEGGFVSRMHDARRLMKSSSA